VIGFFKKIVQQNSSNSNEILQRISITHDNLRSCPKFDKLFKDGKAKFDTKGRLRYLHGAPVGDLILARVNKDGTPVYKESAEEWFDSESPKAKDFIWP